jgi:hypothetical protein
VDERLLLSGGDKEEVSSLSFPSACDVFSSPFRRGRERFLLAK